MTSTKRAVNGLYTFPAANHASSWAMNLMACLLLMLAHIMSGCTSLQPLADNADSLRAGIRSGDVVKPGDKVRVVTRDGLSRLLIVTALDQNTLRGHPEGVHTEGAVVTLPIDDIVFMEGMKVSVGRTAAYSGGVTVGAAMALVIAVIIAFATW